MSKLLEELLRNPTAARYAPNWVSAFIKQGEVTIHFSDSTGQVMMRTDASYTSDVAESVGRAEFDAALKQYPSSTQGEIVQPEPNHALLERILKVTESSNADEACEKYLELLDAHNSLMTILEVMGVSGVDDAIDTFKRLRSSDATLAKLRTELRAASRVSQNVDDSTHIEQLRKDRDLLNARNREIVKLNDELGQLAHYVHETFYPDTGKLVLFRDVGMRLDQLACHVRGIPSVNAAESALTGLLDKMGCKGTGEALEKYRAGLKAWSDLDCILETMGCSNVEEAEEKYLSVATLPEQERAVLVRQRMEAEHGLKKVLAAAEVTNADDAVSIIHMLQSYMVENPSPSQANILHDGQLYRNATVLLRTEQLIVWRDADNQEHSAPAHQVTLNPDDNGLAAAILSRIGSYEVAPEHIAEMRQQMGWLE